MKGLDKAEELKELYERVASQYDPDGFRLYFAAQEITGIKRLWEEYPYEDACGRFTAADGHELLRYLTAAGHPARGGHQHSRIQCLQKTAL